MQSKRIARVARDAFLKEPLFQGFSDLRRNPSIRLQAILMSLFLMPFFGITSLLSMDRTRTQRYKDLFGCRRKMVSSDSTFARVLKWLRPQESEAFLLSFLPKFERYDLLRKPLRPKGQPRRLGILDGSYMGGHWLVGLCLAGRINYPLMLRHCQSQGEELRVARQMMQESGRILDKLRVQLWLLDALYFNTNTIRIARNQKAHVLFKFQQADFRQVTQDAQNLFQHFGADEEQIGWDPQRQCRWKVRKTTDRYAGYPVQVIQLTEYYPKRKRERNTCCWIVTTDMQLALEEVREAAHQRWQIENNVFKRLSHLAGTKRFYFKDPRQFFNLLHFFFAALALLDCILALLRDHAHLFQAVRAGIKDTWRNLFSRIREVLYELPGALVGMT
jgi:hypothetical protein